MRSDEVFSQENAVRLERVRTHIGRLLREQYDTAQPLSDRLAYLLRTLEQQDCQSP
jgi:hypothetical protein